MTINYTTQPIRPQYTYPWVGKYTVGDTHTTVLFIGPEHGFCLDSTDQINMDDRESTNWNEKDFIPCSITLSSL